MEIYARDSELRNLPPHEIQRIAENLRGDDSVLSLVMGNVVRDLDDTNSELRFTSSHVNDIREHDPRPLYQVLTFFNEWATMGTREKRPKLYHLLALFVKCHLFRAADHIAGLIDEAKPDRPAIGPSARVDIAIPEVTEGVEILVNGMDYPYSDNTTNRNRDNSKPQMNSPNMNFGVLSNINVPVIRPPETSGIFNRTLNASENLIIFSTTESRAETVNAEPTQQESYMFLPAFSALQCADPDPIPRTVNSLQISAEHSSIVPNISILVGRTTTNTSEVIPDVFNSIVAREEQANPKPEGEIEASVAESNYNPMISELMKGEPSRNYNRTSNQSSSRSSDDSDEDESKN